MNDTLVDWGLLFAQFALYYGWTPQEVGSLTFPQLLAYWQKMPETVKQDAEVRSGPLAIIFAQMLGMRLTG